MRLPSGVVGVSWCPQARGFLDKVGCLREPLPTSSPEDSPALGAEGVQRENMGQGTALKPHMPPAWLPCRSACRALRLFTERTLPPGPGQGLWERQLLHSAQVGGVSEATELGSRSNSPASLGLPYQPAWTSGPLCKGGEQSPTTGLGAELVLVYKKYLPCFSKHHTCTCSHHPPTPGAGSSLSLCLSLSHTHTHTHTYTYTHPPKHTETHT